MALQPSEKTASKLNVDLARVLPHLQLDAEGKAALADCRQSVEALDRLEQAGLLIEATRLLAHALPAREAVWWACACARHTAASGANPPVETTVREAAEEWVRRQTDDRQRAHLAALKDMGVDLTAFLTQGRADRVIELRGGGKGVSPHLHLDGANGEDS